MLADAGCGVWVSGAWRFWRILEFNGRSGARSLWKSFKIRSERYQNALKIMKM
jgi:hypothetical protein